MLASPVMQPNCHIRYRSQNQKWIPMEDTRVIESGQKLMSEAQKNISLEIQKYFLHNKMKIGPKMTLAEQNLFKKGVYGICNIQGKRCLFINILHNTVTCILGNIKRCRFIKSCTDQSSWLISWHQYKAQLTPNYFLYYTDWLKG